MCACAHECVLRRPCVLDMSRVESRAPGPFRAIQGCCDPLRASARPVSRVASQVAGVLHTAKCCSVGNFKLPVFPVGRDAADFILKVHLDAVCSQVELGQRCVGAQRFGNVGASFVANVVLPQATRAPREHSTAQRGRCTGQQGCCCCCCAAGLNQTVRPATGPAMSAHTWVACKAKH